MNKSELLAEARRLAKEFQEKKETALNILNELDKKQKYTNEHTNGMSAVNELMEEISALEAQYAVVAEQIKK